MNPIVGPNPLELLLLILLGGGQGLPPGVPPTEEAPLAAKVAPAECLVYMSWAGTGTPDKASSNHVEQLLAEPQVRQFMTQAQDRLLEIVRMQGARQEEVRKTLEDASKLQKLLQGKPGAFFLTDIRFEAGGGSPVIKGGGLVRVGEVLDEARRLLEAIQQRGPEESVSQVQIGSRTFFRLKVNKDVPAVTWGEAGDYLVFGLGEGSLEGLMKRAGGEAPQWLTAARKNLAVPRFSSITRVDVKRLLDLTVEQSGDPKVELLLSALGLDQIEHLTTVSGLDDTACFSRTSVEINGPGTGLLKWIDSEALKVDDLKSVVHDAPLALVFKMDASRLFDLWIDVVGQLEPRARDSIRRNLEQTNEFFGIDVREDLLGALGDSWKLFAQPGPKGLDTGWTIAIEVRDFEKLGKAQETLIDRVKALLEQLNRGPSLTMETVDGHDIHMLDLTQTGLPLVPSWCLTKEELFVTTAPESMKTLLSKKGEDGTLASIPDVASLLDDGASTLALVYADTQKVAETLIPMAPLLLQAMGPMGRSFDTSNLPPSKVITKHLSPGFLAVGRTDDGVEITNRRPLPGASVEAAVPVAAAILLPAIGASRAAARRSQASNNLKQLALAMHNFHDTFRALPAGYSADKEGKPLLSWRVHILPFIEEMDLYRQFHFDEPWDSPHNKKLIDRMPSAYKAPGSKCGPGKTNYLGIGGADGVFVRPAEGAPLKPPPGTRFADITDGTSNTIMIVEASDDLAITWTRPGDYSPAKENPVKGLVGLRQGGFQAALTDGSVRFISEAIDKGTLNALFTKSDGEVVNLP